MIKIRLSRGGVIKKAIYKIVALDSTKKRDGANLDVLGTWYPKEKKLIIDKEKLKFWLGKGAQVTQAVKKIL